MTHRPDAQKRKGFTLTETAILLGVLGMVIGSIWVAGSHAHRKAQDNEAATELHLIKQNILDLMQGRPRFTGAVGNDITNDMILAGAIPRVYRNPAGTVGVTPWNGEVRVFIGADLREFRIFFSNLPDVSSCINLIRAGTACVARDLGCPESIRTRVQGVFTNQSPDGTRGWGIVTPEKARDLCTTAPFESWQNGVSFFYSM